MQRASLASVVRAGALLGAGLLWTALVSPAAGEDALLRWVRVASSHPWRTWVALFLLDRALAGGRRTATAQDPSIRAPPLVEAERSR